MNKCISLLVVLVLAALSVAGCSSDPLAPNLLEDDQSITSMSVVESQKDVFSPAEKSAADGEFAEATADTSDDDGDKGGVTPLPDTKTWSEIKAMFL